MSPPLFISSILFEQLKYNSEHGRMSSMRTPLHPACEELSLPNILYALGDPLRLRIVEQLAAVDEAISCGDLHVGERGGEIDWVASVQSAA